MKDRTDWFLRAGKQALLEHSLQACHEELVIKGTLQDLQVRVIIVLAFVIETLLGLTLHFLSSPRAGFKPKRGKVVKGKAVEAEAVSSWIQDVSKSRSSSASSEVARARSRARALQG